MLARVCRRRARARRDRLARGDGTRRAPAGERRRSGGSRRSRRARRSRLRAGAALQCRHAARRATRVPLPEGPADRRRRRLCSRTSCVASPTTWTPGDCCMRSRASGIRRPRGGRSRPAGGWIRSALAERQEQPGECDRRQRHGGHLPVPVDARVEEPGGERGGCACGERAVACEGAPRGERDAGHEGGEAEQPRQPELGGGLDRQRVGIADGLADPALPQPLDPEAGRPDPGQRLAREGVRCRRASTRSGSSSRSSAGRRRRRRRARPRSAARRARRRAAPRARRRQRRPPRRGAGGSSAAARPVRLGR